MTCVDNLIIVTPGFSSKKTNKKPQSATQAKKNVQDSKFLHDYIWCVLFFVDFTLIFFNVSKLSTSFSLCIFCFSVSVYLHFFYCFIQRTIMEESKTDLAFTAIEMPYC